MKGWELGGSELLSLAPPWPATLLEEGEALAAPPLVAYVRMGSARGRLHQTLAVGPWCPSSSFPSTTHRRSLAAEILHHKHHAIVLLVLSTSDLPTLVVPRRRRRCCGAHVNHSEALFIVALGSGSDRNKDLYEYIIHVRWMFPLCDLQGYKHDLSLSL
jgi:hypothetical protein